MGLAKKILMDKRREKRSVIMSLNMVVNMSVLIISQIFISKNTSRTTRLRVNTHIAGELTMWPISQR